MERLPVDDPRAVARVAEALRGGAAVVLPTETVYGVAALPAFLEQLLVLKGRPASVPIAVLVTGVEQATEAAGAPLPAMARTLARAFWPGPLTIVVPAAGGGTLGVRCPDLAFVRAVAAEVGPIATTSANRHGEPTPPTAAEAAAALAGPVAVVVDGGPLAGAPSTVVDATGDAPVVLRDGPIGRARIDAAVR